MRLQRPFLGSNVRMISYDATRHARVWLHGLALHAERHTGERRGGYLIPEHFAVNLSSSFYTLLAFALALALCTPHDPAEMGCARFGTPFFFFSAFSRIPLLPGVSTAGTFYWVIFQVRLKLIVSECGLSCYFGEQINPLLDVWTTCSLPLLCHSTGCEWMLKLLE
jgi:hypothetical protein